MLAYFKAIIDALQTSATGLGITIRHLWQANKTRTINDIKDSAYFSQNTGKVTVQYPWIEVPAPENGRYTLHCEIDDCIVCDKCAKVCPVDCIAIESIKSPEVIGYTSDGTPKRLHAARFDIDMAKCCFCGLCTTVCPTDCLTMTDEYDYSTYSRDALNFQFATLNVAEMALHRQKMAEAQEAKSRTLEVETPSQEIVEPKTTSVAPKPFRPFKPKPSTPSSTAE